MNILILTRYANLGASSRLRFLQYLSWFEQENLNYTLSSLIDDNVLKNMYKKGSYQFSDLIVSYWRRIYVLIKKYDFDLIWIEKEALPWLPAWFEKKMLGTLPYVLDYDDAIFHNYDQHKSFLVRYFFSQRIDKIMKNAALVIVGNSYLAERAINAGAKKVEIIPTVVNLERYPQKKNLRNDGILRIVWIGSPFTIKYIKKIHKPLAILSRKFNFKLRVINSVNIDFSDVDVEFVPWTESTEVDSLQICDIGVMPLFDSAWECGKCGYKLIQYMACSLPVVASPIGINNKIIQNEKNGYLAITDNEWIATLGKLLSNNKLRKKMGEAGRKRVQEEYCTQKTALRLIGLLKNQVTMIS